MCRNAKSKHYRTHKIYATYANDNDINGTKAKTDKQIQYKNATIYILHDLHYRSIKSNQRKSKQNAKATRCRHLH